MLIHRGIFHRDYVHQKRLMVNSKEVRDRIVQLIGDLPRIELFARQKTEGWDVWGNEV